MFTVCLRMSEDEPVCIFLCRIAPCLLHISLSRDFKFCNVAVVAACFLSRLHVFTWLSLTYSIVHELRHMYCGAAYFCVAYFFVSHISVSRIFMCRTCVCRIFLCRISLCLIFLYFVISADSKELVSVPSCKITFVLYYTFPLYWNSQFLHLNHSIEQHYQIWNF